MQTSMSMKQT